jgi:hypothetical protein
LKRRNIKVWGCQWASWTESFRHLLSGHDVHGLLLVA